MNDKNNNLPHPTPIVARGSFRVARFFWAVLVGTLELICEAERHGGVMPEEQKHWEY